MDLMEKYKTRLLSDQENNVNGIRCDLDVMPIYEGEITKRNELTKQAEIIDFRKACKKSQRGRTARSVKGGR